MSLAERQRKPSSARVLKVFLSLLGIYLLLCIPAMVWEKYLDSPMGIVAAFPFLSIYLFHQAGLPGLLQHDGACGWGLCAPSGFGWAFLILFWLWVFWLVAKLICCLFPDADT